MATFEFVLPELGEGMEAGDVVQVLVSVGENITEEQPVLELETDKAVVEVPAPVSGTVQAIHVQAGDKATVGQSLLTIDTEVTQTAAASPAPASPAMARPAPADVAENGVATERVRPVPTAAPAQTTPVSPAVSPSPALQPAEASPTPRRAAAPAAPSVR